MQQEMKELRAGVDVKLEELGVKVRDGGSLPWTLYKDGRHDRSPGVRPKHLDLVVGCSVGHKKTCQNKKSNYIIYTLLFSQRCLSFYSH